MDSLAAHATEIIMSEFFEIPAEAVLGAVHDRLDHFADVFVDAVFGSECLRIFIERSAAAVEFFVGLHYTYLLRVVEPGAFEAAFIDAPNHRRIAADNNKGRDVMRDAGKTGSIDPFADGHELMNAHHAGKPDAGSEMAVAADLAAIAHDDLVFKDAVVADVSADHDEILIADARPFAFMHTRMNGYKFTK
jgi:hypothetical protein